MAIHNDTGRYGEALAVDYFEKKGFEILHKNWRESHWEVDIIAVKNDILHFIEVKTKTKNNYGYPEDEVSRSKIKFLINSAEAYLFIFPQWQRIQFDILAITLKPELSYFLIEDVYL